MEYTSYITIESSSIILLLFLSNWAPKYADFNVVLFEQSLSIHIVNLDLELLLPTIAYSKNAATPIWLP